MGACTSGRTTASCSSPPTGWEAAEAVELANTKYMLEPVLRTFHGRDIRPAAAHLACGVALEEFGEAIEAGDLERLEVPEPHVGNSIRATVLYVDRYGNVQLNLTRDHLEGAGIVPGSKVELEVGQTASRGRGADVRRRAAGDLVVYEDAYRNIALAINWGVPRRCCG